MSFIWLRQATDEFNDALAWYEAQQAGVPERLLAQSARALSLIERFPLAWHPLSARIRAKRLDRFPYSFVYAPQASQDIVLVAFMHQHRKPHYWKNRL
jgi:toxin ParE2